MIQIWWGFLRFLKVVFVPPKFTELEDYLTRQVSHLEAQLARERERCDELSQRIMFPSIEPERANYGPLSAEPQINKEAAERNRLQNLSKQRWLEHVSRQESRAAELMKLDEARAKDARNETTSGQSS